MQPLKKEFKEVDPDTNFTVVYGTTDRDKSNVSFIKARGIFTPSSARKTYPTEIASIKESLAKYINERVEADTFSDDKYIWECNISEKHLEFGKKSSISYSLFLRRNEGVDFNNYKPIARAISKDINKKSVSLLRDNGFII